MPLSLPLLNFPHPLQPVGGANIPDQSHSPAATSISIRNPHVVRNSVPLRLPLSNIPLLSHVLRPVGGIGGCVNQSAVRLVTSVGGVGGHIDQSVSCVPGLRVPLPVFSLLAAGKTTSSFVVSQPRLNGLVSSQQRTVTAATVGGGLAQTNIACSDSPLPASLSKPAPRPVIIPSICLPRRPCLTSPQAVQHIPTMLFTTTSARHTASTAAGSLLTVSSSTHSLLRTILNERMAAVKSSSCSSSGAVNFSLLSSVAETEMMTSCSSVETSHTDSHTFTH